MNEPELTFKDLDADELAEHAFNVFMYQGRHPLGARLIYGALKQESRHALALRCLADLLNQEGMEIFSAITLEYALVHSEALSAEESTALHQILFAFKWAWGFSTHQSDRKTLTAHDFKQHENFTVDHERYQNFIDQLITRSGNLEAAFRSAVTVCGVMAQFLVHEEIEKTARFDEVFFPERFILNKTYDHWLETFESALEEMAARRFVDQMKRMQS